MFTKLGQKIIFHWMWFLGCVTMSAAWGTYKHIASFAGLVSARRTK